MPGLHLTDCGFALCACMRGGGFMIRRAPTIFLAPSALLRRYASSQFNGSMIGLADVPGYITSMIFLRLYPQMLERGGWALPMRVMQIAVIVGGALNYQVWALETSAPTMTPIA